MISRLLENIFLQVDRHDLLAALFFVAHNLALKVIIWLIQLLFLICWK
jgi:hypothetical protein